MRMFMSATKAQRTKVGLACCCGLLILGLSALGYSEASQQPDAAKVLERLREAVDTMHTMSFEMQTTLTGIGIEKRRTITKFWIKDDFFRTDVTDRATPTDPVYHAVYAYNGEKYQRFYPDSELRELNVFETPDMTRPFIGAWPPAVALPYSFAVPRGATGLVPLSLYGIMNNPETWEAIAPNARVVGNEKHGRFDCTVLEVRLKDPKNPDRPLVRRIYCANEYDLYPVYWEESMFLTSLGDYCIIQSVEVQKLKSRRAGDDSPIWFPVRVREVLYCSGEENWVFVTKVAPKSVVIGEAIDDSFSTFPLTEVGFYNDLDNPANNFSTELRDGKRVPKAGSGKAWFDAQSRTE